ncbi:MAG: hypothetical protein WAX44_03960 [Minisyncoccia bacterium]
MKNDNLTGTIILICIIGILLLGGTKGKESTFAPNPPAEMQTSPTIPVAVNPSVSWPSVTWTSQGSLGGNINDPNQPSQPTKEEIEKNYSPYYNLIDLSFISRSPNPNQEYAVIRVTGNLPSPIRVTGWTIRSSETGVSVEIPKGAYLYFSNSPNYEEDIYLVSLDTLYLITGTSPIGVSFRTNKCIGYLSQFQNFLPGLYTNCPIPRNENLSSIPRSPNNDACLDYIESFPACRIQTQSLPVSWSYECTNFIYSKINYPSCVNTHKSDKDFYGQEWRVYLKRSEKLWKEKRERIVLYDENRKIVDWVSY